MIQLRIISPADLTQSVCARLQAEHGATNVVVHVGAGVEPAGDLLVVDVARERGNVVVDELVSMGLGARGSISIVSLDASTSRVAMEAEEAAWGHGSDTLLWEQLEENARGEAARSVTFFVLMMIAAVISAIAVLIDSPVLIVGAMIVGPDYGPLTAIAVGIHRRRAYVAPVAIKLGIGLVLAIVAAVLATTFFRVIDQVPDDFQSSGRFFTSFVTEPNVYSFVVALVAGIAGTISLTQGHQTVLAGVLVSVATLPAAAALGIDLVFGDWDDAGGAALQLTINLAAIVCGSVITLWAHDRAWRRTHARPVSPE